MLRKKIYKLKFYSVNQLHKKQENRCPLGYNQKQVIFPFLFLLVLQTQGCNSKIKMGISFLYHCLQTKKSSN